MWDLPGAGNEPVSPALAGRFSTTGPPGKFMHSFMYSVIHLYQCGSWISIVFLLLYISITAINYSDHEIAPYLANGSP